MPDWKIVFLDAATFDREDVSFARFENTWPCTFHRVTPEAADVPKRVAGHQVAISNKVFIGPETFKACPELKLVAVAATGTNNVDLAAAKACGVPVCNVAGYSGPSVAQHAFALLLELCNHAGQYAVDVRGGAWSKSPFFTRLDYPCTELAGKTLGLIGYGDIAKNMEAMARGFGMEVLAAGRKGQATPREGRTPFDEVLARADVISLHCPLTPETKHLLGKAELKAMKASAFLINTARGGVVDEAALVKALREGWIAGAGFDVATVEPPPADHPLVAAAKELPQLILTPHTAWSTLESRQRLLDEVHANIQSYEKGTPRNAV